MITWDKDCNAPCIGRIVNDDGRDLLIQTDWDYPSVASSFGWSLREVQLCHECNRVLIVADECKRFACQHCDDKVGICCDHAGTDGTVGCPKCGVGAGQFMTAAADWLDDHDGAQIDDPGYFLA